MGIYGVQAKVAGGSGADIVAVEGNQRATLCAGDFTGLDFCGGSDGLDGSGAIVHDILSGGSGNDRIMGDSDEDSLNGGAGDDELLGGAGGDGLLGGRGNDRLLGGEDADELDLNSVVPIQASDVEGNDTLDGEGGGLDAVGYKSLSSAVHMTEGSATLSGSVDTFRNVEIYYGSENNDSIQIRLPDGQSVFAMAGDDAVNVQGDPSPVTYDNVDCGDGSDSVQIDLRDYERNLVADAFNTNCDTSNVPSSS